MDMVTAGRRASGNPFAGSWRIVEMELWKRKDIGELAPARILFNRDGTAYWKEADRRAYEARGARYGFNRRPNLRPLSERWRMINRARSRTRARGEHAFRVVKQLWGFTKVRYRGLAKNLCRAQSVFARARLTALT